MSDEITINTKFLFGRIELHDAPPRIDGGRLYPRGRTVEYDGDGNVVRDEITETGLCITNWEGCAHLFGVVAPKRTLWQRICAVLR